jgi:hypothetical protein
MLCRDFAVELQSSRVATTKVSKCNAMPLVRVSLAFQHNSTLGQKKKGMNALLFVNVVKRQAVHIIEPLSLRKGWVAP